jgi:hypothetical protein
LKANGLRLVVANVMEDVGAESRCRLRELFGEDAFYDALEDVTKAYRQQHDGAVRRTHRAPTPAEGDRGTI